MKDVTLNQRKQARFHVLNSVLEYQAPVAQAAELVGVSECYARRMLAAYRKDDAAALGNLSKLESIRLSGNQLEGCVRQGLQRVPDNDFGALNLSFC